MTTTGLARVTIHASQRRVDIGLPAHVPLAELLPEILRIAGAGLADDGEQHGGWLLRRPDGTPLDSEKPLAGQAVRDGEVLHLIAARQEWPELEYDDVVEAIADGARRRGSAWSPSETRAATLTAAGMLLIGGVLALVRGGPLWAPGGYLAAAAAVLLLVGGVLAARAYGNGFLGAALGGFALPYAFTAGTLLLGGPDPVGVLAPTPWLGAPQLLVGCVSLLVVATLGAAGVGHGVRIFIAGGMAGLLGAAGALLAPLGAAGAAAILLSTLVCGIGLLPLMAIRFGRMPVPPVTFPADRTPGGSRERFPATADLPDRTRVFAAVSRSEEFLTGMLLGYAVLSAISSLVLVIAGGLAGRLLVAVSATALLLRSRLFITVRQRTPLITAGLIGHLLLLSPVIWLADSTVRALVTVGAVLLALIVVLAGQAWSRAAPSPYAGRAADLFDMLVVVSVLPVAAWVLGLYAMIQSIAAL